MTRWIRPENSEAWKNLFEGFTVSAFRLEQLQTYASPEETAAVERFVRGERYDDVDTSWWTSMTSFHRAAGQPMTRVRILTTPFTDYVRWQLEIYPRLNAAGEEIRILLAPHGGRPRDLPRNDFWLIDDREVWRMHYDAAGAYTGAQLLEGPSILEDHRHWRDTAIAQSTPLETFLTSSRRRAS